MTKMFVQSVAYNHIKIYNLGNSILSDKGTAHPCIMLNILNKMMRAILKCVKVFYHF